MELHLFLQHLTKLPIEFSKWLLPHNANKYNHANTKYEESTIFLIQIKILL